MNSRARNWSSAWLALRSLLWTILLPGVFAGYVPWRFFGLGVALLAACIFEFARSGRGTLSPVDAPRHLVVRGLYQYVRNPMYLSVTMIILGEALVAHSVALSGYWAVWFVCPNLFVIVYEEPTLRRTFGDEYEVYFQRVRRWIPRLSRK